MSKQINIPNGLSILRLLTIPSICLLILSFTPERFPVLIAVFSLSMLLDFLDGYLARKLGQETELGKILDPVADKMMALAIGAVLVLKTDFPLWLAVMIVVRDTLIILASYIMMRRSHSVHPSILIGKITFSTLAALFLLYILDLHPGLDLLYAKRFCVVISIGFIVWSFWDYVGVFRKMNDDCAQH